MTLSTFRAVDAGPDAAALIAALDEQAALPAVRRLRAAAAGLLALRSGHRVLDAGCGTGDVARALAAAVAPHGAVLAIDPSETMLSEARRRAVGTAEPVQFRRGDVTRLDVDDASVDRAHCERVFQHVGDPQAAMAELVRVTRPGGRIVVVDTDWGMHAVHGADPDTTAAVVACWAASTANGWSGRRLPALFAGAGVADAAVVAETLTSTDPHRPSAPPFTTMAALAEHTGDIGAGRAEAWLAELAEAASHGRFFWAVTMFAVAGTRR